MVDPTPIEFQQAEDERKAMKQGMITRQLSPHFTLGEFLHEHSFEGVTPEIVENLTALCLKLEKVRALLGKPMIITSGFRTPAHNRRIGGAPHSYHLQGMAVDFVVPGMSPHKVQSLLDDTWDGGLEYAPTWTHLDSGPRRRFNP